MIRELDPGAFLRLFGLGFLKPRPRLHVLEGYMRVGIIDGQVVAAGVIPTNSDLLAQEGEQWIEWQEQYAKIGTPMQVEVWPAAEAMPAFLSYAARVAELTRVEKETTESTSSDDLLCQCGLRANDGEVATCNVPACRHKGDQT